MSARVRTPLPGERPRSRPRSSLSHPGSAGVVQAAPDSGRGTPERRTPHTISAALSSKEQQMMDDLAMLFTVQEERCFSRASRETTSLSRASLTSSQLADATFIYQHVDFQVLSRCVPTFVKSHLNRNGRYLPETFILRVNYLRRRRALGEDSTAKRAAKEHAAKENAAKEMAAKTSGDQTSSSQSRLASARSSRTQSTSSKLNSLSESHVTLISG